MISPWRGVLRIEIYGPPFFKNLIRHKIRRIDFERI